MPKRSEKRDTAKAEYIARKSKGESVNLRELAEQQGAGEDAEHELLALALMQSKVGTENYHQGQHQRGLRYHIQKLTVIHNSKFLL